VREAIGIDSYVLLVGNLPNLFDALDLDVFVATEQTLAEERDDSDVRRAQMWHLDVGRVLPVALTSGEPRVTESHYHLMKRWWELLQSMNASEA
jgi:hypothetical protein